MVENNKETIGEEIETELETEYKSLLSKERFDHLKDYFAQFTIAKPSYIQTNYYFDTDDYQLIRQGITVRLRNKKNKWQFQLKLPQNTEGNYNQHQEFNQFITNEEADNYIKNGLDEAHPIIADMFKKRLFEPMELKMIGSLQTKRYDYEFYSDLISLDESSYLGVTDYELEWETTNHKFALYELDRLAITPIKGVGKITRFLDRLLKSY